MTIRMYIIQSCVNPIPAKLLPTIATGSLSGISHIMTPKQEQMQAFSISMLLFSTESMVPAALLQLLRPSNRLPIQVKFSREV